MSTYVPAQRCHWFARCTILSTVLQSSPKNIRLLLCVVLLLPLLSGCITMEAKQKIERNGKTSVQALAHISISQLKESSQGIAEDVGEQIGSTSKGEMTVSLIECASLTTILQNVRCIKKGEDTMFISGTTQLEEPAFTVKKSGVKSIYIYHMSDVLRVLSNPDTPTTIESLKETPQFAQVRLTYTIIMPGKITQADIGKVKGKAVTFNLMSLIKKPEAIVRSEELMQKSRKEKGERK